MNETQNYSLHCYLNICIKIIFTHSLYVCSLLFVLTMLITYPCLCRLDARTRVVSEPTASAQPVGPEGVDWCLE